MTSSGCGATPAGTKSLTPRWRPSAGRRALDAALAVAIAPVCAACDSILEAPLDGPVCPACWQAIRLLPARAEADVDDAFVGAARGAVVAADYRGPLRRIIHAFKYEARRSLARPLARLMAEAAPGVLADAGCVVPVPLHPWKRLTRGFNQAADLAGFLGPPVVYALWRARLTPAQVGLPAAERRRNIRGAFVASPLLRRRDRALIGSGVVVLVDDVRTTGATLGECAAVLTAMGARDVRAITLAQAPARDS